MSPLEQLALRSEKLSSLQPYANFSRIFAILCGFLLLGERNIVTFIVAIIAFLGTVIYATRGKQRRFSRGVLMYLGDQLSAIGWARRHATGILFFFFYLKKKKKQQKKKKNFKKD